MKRGPHRFGCFTTNLARGGGTNVLGVAGQEMCFVFLMLYERWEFWDALAYLKRHHVQGTSSWWMKNPRTLLWAQLKIPFPPISRDEIEMDASLPF